MRKHQVKVMAAGILILVFMVGCGKDNAINAGKNGTVSEETDDREYHAVEQQGQNEPKSEQSLLQSVDNVPAEDIERELAAYRAERERLQWTKGGYEYAVAPSGNYKYGVGNFDSGPDFDIRELTSAFKTAGDYIEGTLKLESAAYEECVDPRMNAIYEDEDKGVANGYENDNIFLCEYEDHGKWQYLILVREGKGSDWKVLYHGSNYKKEKNDGGDKK